MARGQALATAQREKGTIKALERFPLFGYGLLHRIRAAEFSSRLFWDRVPRVRGGTTTGAKSIGQRSAFGEQLAAKRGEGVSLGGGEEGLHFPSLPHAVVTENIDAVFLRDGAGSIGAVDFGNKFQPANAQGFD